MSSTTTSVSRRSALRGAVAVAGAGAVGAALAPAGAAAATSGPLRVRTRIKLVDKQGDQRFLLQSKKPPVYLLGKTYPAEARQGPPHGTWFIFNDENQSEKGGLTASTNGVSLSFDYPQVQALTLATAYAGKLGAAQLSMNQMPDPDIPIEELKPEDVPQRLLLGCSNAGDGSLLFLYDSKERPRITLHVDGDDVPRIQILDADGNVVAQLPPEAPLAAAPKRGEGLKRFFGGGLLKR
jgi:hypothetical protein